MKKINLSLRDILMQIIVVSGVLTFVAPLVVTQQSYFPFMYPKATLIQIFIEVMVAAWIILAYKFPEYRPSWKNPMVEAVAIFAASLIVVLPFSIDVQNSFFSMSSRMTGLFQYLHYFLFFLVIISVFKTWKEWKILFFTSTLVSLVAALFGFMKMNGLAEARISSTMGNPIFLGVFALVNVFIVLILLAKESEKKWKIFYSIALAVNVFALLLSVSRGPLLGLAMAMVCIFILSATVFLKGRSRLKVILGSLLIVALSVGLFITLRIAPVESALRGYMPYPVSRVVYAKVGGDRIDVWKMGIQAFRDRPLYGWGQENFIIPSNLYMDRVNTQTSLRDVWYDKVHNQFIEMLALTGIIGFLGYIYMWGTAIWLSLKLSFNSKDKNVKLWSIVLVSAYAGQIVSLMFLFDVPNTLPTMFLFFAFGAYLYGKERNLQRVVKPISIDNRKIALVSLLVIGLMGLLMFKFTLIPFYQSHLNTKGVIGTDSANLTKAVEYYERSLSFDTHLNDELRFFAHDAISSRAKLGDQSEAMMDYLEFLTGQFEDQIQKTPNDYRVYIFAAELNRWLGYRDIKYLDRAEEIATQSLILAPLRPEGYQELAEIALAKGEPDKALELLIEAAERVGDMKMMAGEIRARAASAFFRKHNSKLAFSVLRDAAQKGYPIYGDARVAVDIGSNYDESMDLSLAISFVDRIWTVYRDHSGVLHSRAVLYNAAGDDIAVRAIIQIVRDSDPEFADHMEIEFGFAEDKAEFIEE